MSQVVNAPNLALEVDDLVDWLELAALFDPYGVSRLDALLGSLAELEPTAEDDIGRRDQGREQLVERIEAEVSFRQKTLEDTYPYQLSESGDEVTINLSWRDEPKLVFYIVCLVAAHATGSSILDKPPTDEMLLELRNKVFQIVATLGVAGLAGGPAFSVGWPRQSGEAIVELLNRAAAAGAGFTVRNPPGAYTPPKEKDGGIDVIAFTLDGQPPPTVFYFGQTASGRNWEDKPVANRADTFTAAYIQDHATGNITHVTLIPFRVIDQRHWNLMHQYHRAILERSRLPLRAWQGLQLSAAGVPVDGADLIDDVRAWVYGYCAYAQAA
ncbi:MAG TPA: hypothetical protein VF559_03600 [Caulobacteraceae bacterium]|jgi:hypothetical protein